MEVSWLTIDQIGILKSQWNIPKMKLLSFAIALGLGEASSTDLSTLFLSEESGVTLYSESALLGEDARVHVATFDAYKHLEHKSGNCQTGEALWLETATSGIKY